MRQRVKRHLLCLYLRMKGVEVAQNADKKIIVKQILEFWRSRTSMTTSPHVPTGKPSSPQPNRETAERTPVTQSAQGAHPTVQPRQTADSAGEDPQVSWIGIPFLALFPGERHL